MPKRNSKKYRQEFNRLVPTRAPLPKAPIPDVIPEDTSPYIADAIRRRRLEQEQARILAEALQGQEHLIWEQRMERRRARAYRHTIKYRSPLSKVDRISRDQVIERDHSTCYLCGRNELANDEIHIDHVIPLSRGGHHVAENVRVACAPCNLRKGAMTEDEYRATLVD